LCDSETRGGWKGNGGSSKTEQTSIGVEVEELPTNEVADLEVPTQENVRTDLRSVFQGAIRVVLELVLEEELREMVGAARWERFGRRMDLRNGTYLR
jgi:hypothetical protein